MPFRIYWWEEVVAASAAGYSKLALVVLSRCPLLVLLGLLLSFSSSIGAGTGTGTITVTGEDYDLVALGLV